MAGLTRCRECNQVYHGLRPGTTCRRIEEVDNTRDPDDAPDTVYIEVTRCRGTLEELPAE